MLLRDSEGEKERIRGRKRELGEPPPFPPPPFPLFSTSPPPSPPLSVRFSLGAHDMCPLHACVCVSVCECSNWKISDKVWTLKASRDTHTHRPEGRAPSHTPRRTHEYSNTLHTHKCVKARTNTHTIQKIFTYCRSSFNQTLTSYTAAKMNSHRRVDTDLGGMRPFKADLNMTIEAQICWYSLFSTCK